MKLVSVNLSMPKTVDHLGRRVNTGIYNEPVDGRVMVRKLNVDGDVFRIGGALLEVTQPRLPCFKLEMKMDLPAFAHPCDPA
jgi:MOSC domain-containing protein YiiM